MNDTVLEHCAKLLRTLERDTPWMTATGLARRIALLGGPTIAARDIETALIAHGQLEAREIRHSHYPSKRTLDLLWGHVDVVGERGNLAELHRLDAPDPVLSAPAALPDDAPWAFLSHNHRDFGAAVELREILARHGCGTWLFETDIPAGATIAPTVQRALGDCDVLLAYVTRRSIGSLWVQKELEATRRGGRTRTELVIDGEDAELRQLFAAWTGAWPPEREHAEKFFALSAAAVGQRPDSAWARRAAEFVHSLHEFVGDRRRVLAYPPIPAGAQAEWSEARLAVESIDAHGTMPRIL